MQKQKMKILGALQGAPFLKDNKITVLIADSFFTRLGGLMFRKSLPQETGLLLAPCNSVHVCFMRFAIDVVYLDKEYRIIKVVNNLKPWIGVSLCRKAWATLELPAGEAERCGLTVGTKLIREKEL